MTLAAIHVSEAQKHTDGGGLIPYNIVPRAEGGKQPVAVADNWDHNERTVDGKNTTHALTSIVVAPKGTDEVLDVRISRAPTYTFSEDKIPGNISFYDTYIEDILLFIMFYQYTKMSLQVECSCIVCTSKGQTNVQNQNLTHQFA